MDLFFPLGGKEEGSPQVLWEDGERIFCRGWRLRADGHRLAALAVVPVAEHPPPDTIESLAHEYELKDELDGAWAVRPLELVRERGRTILVLEDPGGELLEGLLGQPMAVRPFLHLSLGLAAAIARLHQRGLIHKDIKPAHLLVDRASGAVHLSGFGIASRLPRERQAPGPPAVIAGTLAYMAPEQTGRMNRSIDARSDLYAVGVTLYRMLTGSLPFTATDPMEWVHCHIARRPVPPAERVPGVPAALSAIIMKLLAKTAEERYQTAAGLERDLRRCLTQWEAQGRIDDFPLGEDDTPDRLLIAEKLYGRAREVDALLAAFGRVVTSGAPELVLVSGYSGIGKTAVVHELHKALVPSRGLFASGKFDQYKRDIPYATLVQAFQSLVRSLLGNTETELASWRAALSEALGPNGRLMADLVPELTLVVGDQPPVPELPPQDAQRRFQLVFRRFIGVFARPEHPLALFLDDLQWLDAATLDLIEDLLTQADVRHLLLIGAYRDNEVDALHPLRRKLAAMKNESGKVVEITLAPLADQHVGQLIADALRCTLWRAARLTQLVHERTAGNPFFVIQFLYALAEERLLAFDHGASGWTWGLEQIRAKGYTDNVVDLMVGKLTRLPAETQSALQLLACLGNSAEIARISIVLDSPQGPVDAALWPAVQQELIERQDGAYRFAHDRVQEAAYSLIPEQLRAEAHLRIGRLLAAHIPPEKREEAIFDIVSQLDRGASLITSQDEREQLAQLNLIAGKRAKASTAYASALIYLVTGATLLAEDSWERRHELNFELELLRAECEFVTGAMAAADERLKGLSTRAANTVERASVACLHIDLYTTVAQSSRAIAVALDYLRRLGIEWSPHPTDEDVRREYDRIWSQLGSSSIEDLLERPLMTDPASLATIDVLTRVAPAALTLMEANFHALAICWAANLSLERGNSDASCDIYVRVGFIAGDRFGDYKAGSRFGKVGCELVERHGLKRFEARTYLLFAHYVIPYTQHVRAARDLLNRGFEAANKTGDLVFVALYSGLYLIEHLLASGYPLSEVQAEIERGLAFAQKAQLVNVVSIIQSHLGLVRTLRGLTRKFGAFDDEEFGDARSTGNPNSPLADWLYWMRKVQARFHAGDYAAAIEAATRAQRHTASGYIYQIADLRFYSALSYAAVCDTTGQREANFVALCAHHRQLEIWAEQCPENFENHAALVGAEIARLEGRDVDAMRLYQQGIRSARANGFVRHEALAYELAARFYAARGFDEIAHLYLRNARYAYLRWGADGKVRQLDEIYPQLRIDEPAPTPTSTIGTPVEHLDLATVLKVSQAVSGEIVLERLLDTLMRMAIEQAGAQRGLLIVPRGKEQWIEAEATTHGDIISVHLHDKSATADTLPESILHYVVRTREAVLLGDAAAENPFAGDAYLRQHQMRSVFCLPLINQSKLIGVLYLENNLAPHVFTPERTAMLKLLASQAAISLENTRLYRDVVEREARIRRLVDANIIGIFIWGSAGQIFEANDAFLHMVGHDREDLVAGRLRWTDLTPPEWRRRHRQFASPEIRMTGTLRPYEKEYFRSDGSRVPVLVGAASFNESGNQGVSFVLDLTERKRSEAEARDSERRYREVQMELAHANRVATMGQLTVSIAHEVKQPISAVVTSAQAARRWLDRQPPHLEEARQALARIAKDGHRAGEVIGRIRGLITKAPPRKGWVDLNEAIREVIELTRGETVKTGVSVQTRLADNLPLIHGDRVQLQQVILNLIVNAIEAMSGVRDGPRELLISTGKVEPDGVLVAVRDTGPGLAPATFDRLFEAFYTTKPGGLGMGLSICRSIIQAQGGRLWAEANEPRGAVFQFLTPTQP